MIFIFRGAKCPLCLSFVTLTGAPKRAHSHGYPVAQAMGDCSGGLVQRCCYVLTFVPICAIYPILTISLVTPQVSPLRYLRVLFLSFLFLLILFYILILMISYSSYFLIPFSFFLPTELSCSKAAGFCDAQAENISDTMGCGQVLDVESGENQTLGPEFTEETLLQRFPKLKAGRCWEIWSRFSSLETADSSHSHL